MAFSYSSDSLDESVNKLRFLVQDTVDTGHFFEDAEIQFALDEEANIYRAAASLCRAAAVKLSKTPSLDDATVKFEADKRAANYLKLAESYDQKAISWESSSSSGTGSGGMNMPTIATSDTDPAFTRGLHQG